MASANHESPINITHHLKGMSFPASKDELEKHAKQNGADQNVLTAIKAMPEHRFETIADVMKAFGQERRG